MINGTSCTVLEEGGTGPYKAVMYEVEGFKEHTVFAPKDLSVFSEKKALPVLVWGNGGCANSPRGHEKFLNDIAYNNGMDDFKRIDHVPAIACNLPVGHGGTYNQPNGGEFAIVARAWLDWQLKGNQEASKMFCGDSPAILQRKDWTLEKNAKVK